MVYIRNTKNNKSATYMSVLNCFYFGFWQRLPARSVQTYKKRIFFSVFSCLHHFANVFRQVKECLILQLHEIIKVIHEVACLIVFMLIYDWYWQVIGLKRMKNDHIFSIFSRFCPFPFPKLLGRLMIDLCQKCMKW